MYYYRQFAAYAGLAGRFMPDRLPMTTNGDVISRGTERCCANSALTACAKAGLIRIQPAELRERACVLLSPQISRMPFSDAERDGPVRSACCATTWFHQLPPVQHPRRIKAGSDITPGQNGPDFIPLPY